MDYETFSDKYTNDTTFYKVYKGCVKTCLASSSRVDSNGNNSLHYYALGCLGANDIIESYNNFLYLLDNLEIYNIHNIINKKGDTVLHYLALSLYDINNDNDNWNSLLEELIYKSRRMLQTIIIKKEIDKNIINMNPVEYSVAFSTKNILESVAESGNLYVINKVFKYYDTSLLDHNRFNEMYIKSFARAGMVNSFKQIINKYDININDKYELLFYFALSGNECGLIELIEHYNFDIGIKYLGFNIFEYFALSGNYKGIKYLINKYNISNIDNIFSCLEISGNIRKLLIAYEEFNKPTFIKKLLLKNHIDVEVYNINLVDYTNIECSICQEYANINSCIISKCEHVFHVRCLFDINLLNGSAILKVKCCPNCRRQNFI